MFHLLTCLSSLTVLSNKDSTVTVVKLDCRRSNCSYTSKTKDLMKNNYTTL